jgi:hypothetical protein
MATGADHRPRVGYPPFERLLVHIATLADDSGEPRSITYRRISETPVTPSTDLMPWAGAGWSGQRVFP